MNKPSYYDWDMDDWFAFHANERYSEPIEEITTRNFNTKRNEYIARVMKCEYVFKFAGHVFVCHRDPDPEPHLAETSGGDVDGYTISELHTGFRLACGFDPYDARIKARKVLIANGRNFKKQMSKAFDIIQSKTWITEYDLSK
jgi:hypothetical protein